MISQATHSTELPMGSMTERWDADLARSTLSFKLQHIVVQQIRGRFRLWGGTLFINRGEPSLSSARVWIDLASIDTGDQERDAHVRSPEFFDVARFPHAELESTDVRIAGDQVIVEGRLDLHGVVHDVELRASLGPSRAGADERPRIRCIASGTLNRQSFDLHWNQDLDAGGIVVGDEVEITGDIELVRADEEERSTPSWDDLPVAPQR